MAFWDEWTLAPEKPEKKANPRKLPLLKKNVAKKHEKKAKGGWWDFTTITNV